MLKERQQFGAGGQMAVRWCSVATHVRRLSNMLSGAHSTLLHLTNLSLKAVDPHSQRNQKVLLELP
jgi:hypothetical protein